MSKKLFRSPALQAAIGRVIGFYQWLLAASLRWKIEGEEHIRPVWEGPQGCILASWHSRILLLTMIQYRLSRRWKPPPHRAAMMVSHSPDGAFVAIAAAQSGVEVVRGSTSNPRKRDKQKGSMQAVRDTIRLMRAGSAVCITVDGPRGPREIAQLGPVKIAQQLQMPLMVYAVSARPAQLLDTWDRFMLPMPFGRGAAVFLPPFHVPPDADAEAARAELDVQLGLAHARADELLRSRRSAAKPDAHQTAGSS